MIRWLLLLLVAVFWTGDVLTGDISLAPGLSIKNAVLYLIVAALVLRKAMGYTGSLRLPRIRTYFAVWIGYAVLTSAVAAFYIHYSGYHLSKAIIELKAELVDPAFFCLAVFYGLSDEAEVRFFLKALVGAIAFANVLTLASLAGIVNLAVHIGDAGAEYGRVFGFFGHANETGELIACLLPSMIVFSARGSRPARMLWYCGILGSAMVLILTVSRGAYIALLLSTVGGAYLCRKYVNLSRLLMWGLIVLALMAVAVTLACVMDPQIRGVLAERLFGQSTSIDVGVVSSGRTDLWEGALDKMMDAPVTFVTGYGWYVYQSMPFQLSAHNYYLETWFDLGLVGVTMFVLIMYRTVALAIKAMPYASEEERQELFALVCAVLAILVGVSFTLIFVPWPYLWMYIGAMLRIAVLIRSSRRSVAAPVRAAPQAPIPTGWVAAGRQSHAGLR